MQKRIPILFIIDRIYFGTGGTEKQLLMITNGLDERKFDVTLLVLMETPWFDKYHDLLKRQIFIMPISKFKKPHTYYNILRLIFLIKRIKPQIVHTFFPISNIVGVIAARLAGVNVVISSRRDFGEWMKPLVLLLTRIANFFATKILANSFAVKELTKKKEGINSNKIKVIYNGLDLKSFVSGLNKSKGDIRKELNIPFDRRIIGTVANLRLMKRLDTFLYAAREVLKVKSDVYFIIVGTGPEEGNLRRVAKELGIDKLIYFAGRQYDLNKYFSCFDIAVNCSEKEGLSNAIMEYMVFGIPCIVSRAGGNQELIEHGINGYTFELGNHEELANLILSLLKDKKKQREFASKSKNKAQNQLTMSRMLSDYEDFYMKIRK